VAFSWVLHDEAGARLRETDGFDTRGAAEEWLGREWRTVREEGAESVSLLEDGAEVYRMGLGEP
jgi:hypothetical protein